MTVANRWRGIDRPMRFVLAFIALAAVAMVAIGLSSIGSSSGSSAAVSPAGCLSKAGLVNVEAKGASTWRGMHGYPAYLVFVDEMGSSSAAARAASQATLVVAQSAGRFMVSGPSVGTDSGADVVGKVASCLGS